MACNWCEHKHLLEKEYLTKKQNATTQEERNALDRQYAETLAAFKRKKARWESIKSHFRSTSISVTK
jgi:hypothetical protein